MQRKFVVMVLALFWAAGWMGNPPVAADEAVTMRELAERRGVKVGGAIGSSFWREADREREIVAREFNAVVAENVMKASIIHPERGRYEFGQADAIVEFAQEHGMMVRGHTLVWHRMQPRWMAQGEFSRDLLIAVLREHIHTVAGRYKGKIAEWDVVNEAIDDGGGLRKSFWLETIGEDYIDLAFQFAHEADPDALLFYNDYGAEGMGRKSGEVYALVKGMLERGVPIHGVGLQCHLDLRANVGPIRENVERLEALGLRVSMTEVDIALKLPATEEDLAKQAEIYGQLMGLALERPETRGTFMVWGLSDRHSWISGERRGYGDPLLFDGEYRPKAAYAALVGKLRDGDGS